MSDDFQQTVDLKLKKDEPKKRLAPQKTVSKKVEEIDEVFNDKEGKKDLKKIEKFKEKQVNENLFRRVVMVLAFIIMSVIFYMMVFNNEEKVVQPSLNWYAVRLVSGEVYYGEVEDEKANPIVIKNVYYNYDQIKEDGKLDPGYKLNENGNIRLVKLGKETYGPSGKMLIYQSQVKEAFELASDSNVLKAIINYEK